MTISTYQTGLAQLRTGQWTAALTTFEDLLRTYPEFAAAYEQRGQVHLRLGNTTQAIADFKQAAQLFLKSQDKVAVQRCLSAIERLQTPLPSLTTTYHFGETPTPAQLVTTAHTKLRQGNRQGAIADLDWLLRCVSEDASALMLRALALAQVGRRTQALQDFQQALLLRPEDKTLMLQGIQVRVLLGDGVGAIADCDRLLALDYRPAEVLLQRGLAQQALGNGDQAFKDFSNGLGLAEQQGIGGVLPDPRSELYLARGEVCQAQADLEGALADYQRAVQWATQADRSDRLLRQRALDQITAVKALLAEKAALAARTFRVPIKYRRNGIPVVDVILEGRYCFEMIVDTGCSAMLVTGRMAQTMGLVTTEYGWSMVGDGRLVPSPIAQLKRVEVNGAIVENLPTIVEAGMDIGLLGQAFLQKFEMQILEQEIELRAR